jgi:hypothetical protein
MHPDPDAALVHGADEIATSDGHALEGQQHLEHVPVGVREIGHRELAAQVADEAR